MPANRDQPPSRRDKFFLSGVFSVFGLISAALAVYALTGIAGEVSGWLSARTWQPVMAEIDELNIAQSGSKQGGSRYIEAKYRYRVGTVEFKGSRVGRDDTAWSPLSGWQDEWFEELVVASNRDKRIMVWYDPANPGVVVIDRELRWSLLWSRIPIAGFFSVTALAALWLLTSLWRGDPGEKASGDAP